MMDDVEEEKGPSNKRKRETQIEEIEAGEPPEKATTTAEYEPGRDQQTNTEDIDYQIWEKMYARYNVPQDDMEKVLKHWTLSPEDIAEELPKELREQIEKEKLEQAAIKCESTLVERDDMTMQEIEEKIKIEDRKIEQYWEGKSGTPEGLLENLDLGPELSEDTVKRIKQLTWKYRKVYAIDLSHIKVGCSKRAIHIGIDRDKLRGSFQRPMTLFAKTLMTRYLKYYEKCNIARPSETQALANAFLVAKKGCWIRNWKDLEKAKDEDLPANFRMVVDLKIQNEAVAPFNDRSDGVQAVLAFVPKDAWLLTFDFFQFFYQICTDKPSKEILTFFTPTTSYAFMRMIMGLKCSSGIGTKILELCLHGIADAEKFILADNVHMKASNEEELVDRYEQALQRCVEWNLKIKSGETNICRTTSQKPFTILGHEITNGVIKPVQRKVSSIQQQELPRTLKQLRGLIGQLSFFRAMTPLFSYFHQEVVEELKRQTDKGGRFQLTPIMEKGVRTMLTLIVKAPGLHLLTRIELREAPFLIWCDASAKHYGGVASVLRGNKIIPFYAISRSFPMSNRHWHISRLECLAIFYCLNEMRFCLEGRSFYVVTDSTYAKALMTLPLAKLNGKLRAYAALIREKFIFKVFSIGTKENISDCLSRLCRSDHAPDPKHWNDDLTIREDNTSSIRGSGVHMQQLEIDDEWAHKICVDNLDLMSDTQTRKLAEEWRMNVMDNMDDVPMCYVTETEEMLEPCSGTQEQCCQIITDTWCEDCLQEICPIQLKRGRQDDTPTAENIEQNITRRPYKKRRMAPISMNLRQVKRAQAILQHNKHKKQQKRASAKQKSNKQKQQEQHLTCKQEGLTQQVSDMQVTYEVQQKPQNEQNNEEDVHLTQNDTKEPIPATKQETTRGLPQRKKKMTGRKRLGEQRDPTDQGKHLEHGIEPQPLTEQAEPMPMITDDQRIRVHQFPPTKQQEEMTQEEQIPPTVTDTDTTNIGQQETVMMERDQTEKFLALFKQAKTLMIEIKVPDSAAAWLQTMNKIPAKHEKPLLTALSSSNKLLMGIDIPDTIRHSLANNITTTMEWTQYPDKRRGARKPFECYSVEREYTTNGEFGTNIVERSAIGTDQGWEIWRDVETEEYPESMNMILHDIEESIEADKGAGGETRPLGEERTASMEEQEHNEEDKIKEVLSQKEIKDAQALDKQIQEIIKWIQITKAELPEQHIIRIKPPFTRKLISMAGNLKVINNTLYLEDLDTQGLKIFRIIVPTHIRIQLVEQYHWMYSHQNPLKIQTQINELYYIHDLRNVANKVFRDCKSCRKAGPARLARKRKIPNFSSIPDTWAIDLLSMPMCEGQKYILVITCLCTAYVKLMPLATKTAGEVTDGLIKAIQERNTFPRFWVSDGGKEFVNQVMRQLIDFTGAKGQILEPFQKNSSRSEVTNSRLLTLVRRAHHDNYKWTTELKTLEMTLNQSAIRIDEALSTPSRLVHFTTSPAPKANLDRVPIHIQSMEAFLRIRKYIDDLSREKGIDSPMLYDTNTEEQTFEVGEKILVISEFALQQRKAHGIAQLAWKIFPRYTEATVTSRCGDTYMVTLENGRSKRMNRKVMKKLNHKDEHRERT